MDTQDLSPSHVDASRPSLGFPLGTALLLIIIFSLSGIFSCCYHWDKLRSLRQSLSHSDPHPSPAKPNLLSPDWRRNRGDSLPVLMPGDEVPKFIAMPCPCAPSRPENVMVSVEEPPPKPPHLSVPYY
ncbi:uncharacterized protein At5g65660-like [Prosopis cineraria]|uniref:uncharacterized protein At5g65660-like n=1 Tax=Prosopis cineraria TaxID=364024 RepID=UPI00240EB6CE|nr:uncharacterized protein At5g65660-like [Prosopis cineraria]XP_054790018.1 uncharacterized protein At5g65660-like [Prosopis cineraria]